MKNTYVTGMAECAEKMIGTKWYYCCYREKFFDEGNVKDCHKGCQWSCDRRNYPFMVKNGLNGVHMMPIGKDPLVEVSFSEIPDDMKIVREIYDEIKDK